MSKPLRHPRLRFLATIMALCLLLVSAAAWALSYPTIVAALPHQPRRETIWAWARTNHIYVDLGADRKAPAWPAFSVAADSSQGTWALFLKRGQFSFHAFRTAPGYTALIWCHQSYGWYTGIDRRGYPSQGGDYVAHLGPDYIPPTLANVLGFNFHTETKPYGTQYACHIPLWAPTLLCLFPTIYLAFTLYAHHRARRRQDHNLCPTCGYDLRAQLTNPALPPRARNAALPSHPSFATLSPQGAKPPAGAQRSIAREHHASFPNVREVADHGDNDSSDDWGGRCRRSGRRPLPAWAAGLV